MNENHVYEEFLNIRKKTIAETNHPIFLWTPYIYFVCIIRIYDGTISRFYLLMVMTR